MSTHPQSISLYKCQWTLYWYFMC